MTVHALNTERIEPFTLADRLVIPCGRTGLHMCKIVDMHLLQAVWLWMRAGIQRIHDKSAPGSHCLPEHVRAEIVRGFIGQSTTECFLAHDGEQGLHGFLIAYALTDPFVQVPLRWFVWLCNIDFRVLDMLLPEFEQLALDRGFVAWEWITARQGWARRAAKFGARVCEYRLRKELELHG